MDSILDTVRARWGFDALRPLQRQAIEASLAGRDALVVLPTGGGRSVWSELMKRTMGLAGESIERFIRILEALGIELLADRPEDGGFSVDWRWLLAACLARSGGGRGRHRAGFDQSVAKIVHEGQPN